MDLPPFDVLDFAPWYSIECDGPFTQDLDDCEDYHDIWVTNACQRNPNCYKYNQYLTASNYSLTTSKKEPNKTNYWLYFFVG